MTPIAFYAPLKAPTHDTPSGDRELARGLMRAAELAGYETQLASELRLLDMTGDAAVQAQLQKAATEALPAIIAHGRAAGWRLWLTYHNYYKAPDLLGPAVSQALGIPYVQVESTRARKRLTGPWAAFAKAAEQAADAADAICYFTARDAEALRAYAPEPQQHVHLRPFLPRDTLPAASDRSGAMLVAAMMRPGDKLASYRLIADTLAVVEGDWALDIAGDGDARDAVAALMAPFGPRVRFLGALDADGMARAYQTARLLVWPGVNEAIGLTYLEAQAAGIPVLAQDRPGLRDVLAPGNYPDPNTGSAGLARALTQVLQDPPDADPIRAFVQKGHLLPAAARTLRDTFAPLIGRPV